MGMTKEEIKAELKSWGYDEDQYSNLPWSELQAFYSGAKDDQQALEKAQAEAAGDSDGDETLDPSEESGGGEPDAGDNVQTSADAEEPGSEESKEGSGEEQEEADQDEIDEDLVKAEVLATCEAASLGLIIVGDKSFNKGRKVKLEEGTPVAMDQATFDHLRMYRCVKAVS